MRGAIPPSETAAQCYATTADGREPCWLTDDARSDVGLIDAMMYRSPTALIFMYSTVGAPTVGAYMYNRGYSYM